ncbi:MAG: hypothetical protein JWL81_1171, partial [Verrucomicrobiales bacterium]|nr:hypothetical protein [Verrucomicrobiales bacterium]
AGKVVDGHLLNPSQTLELSGTDPVAITSLTPEKLIPKDAAAPIDVLSIHIANAGPDTRVHVLVSRLLPEFDAFAALAGNGMPDLTYQSNVWRPSLYQSARTIGEEYRYVLERQSLQAFAGNLLPRPGLLLNPWAIADTTTETQVAAEGEALKAMTPEKKAETLSKRRNLGMVAAQQLHDRPETDAAAGGAVAGKDIAAPKLSADLSFLAEAGATAFNLKPDANGNVHIAAGALGHGQMMRVVAVSGESSAVRDFILPDKPIQVRDLRLIKGLDPAGHFAQQNTVTVLEKDAPFVLKDALSARHRPYADLDSARDLLTNLSKNPTLAEFAFLRTWPSLDAAAKRSLYSKFACHELSFFLSRKDPEFFKSVIQPYLINKRDRTFMDDYLLHEVDPAPVLERWLALTSYQKLNTAEKLLFARAWDQAHLKFVVPHLTTAQRDLDDYLITIPRDPAKDSFWFESALGSIAGNELALGQTQMGRGGVDAFSDSAFVQADVSSYSAPPRPASAPAPAPAPATAAPAEDALVELRAARSHERLKEANMGEDWAYQQAAKNKPLYRQTELTKEFAENNYYQILNADQIAGLIQPNRFWQDYARWDGKGPFLSANLAEATNNFSEMMLALAVLDLPFAQDTKPAKSELKDGVLTLVPTGRSLLFRQEIKAAEPDKDGVPLLVSQNFYLAGDRFTETNGEKSDKFVEGEFLAGVVYGSRVVVTNPGSSRRKLDVLFQIPTGAVPVEKTRATQSLPITLEGFHTQTLDFNFYFPQPGEFVNYPVHVSREGKIAAAAAPVKFKVVTTLTTLDKTSWEYLSQHGSTDEVIAYLEKHNLHATDLERAAWRLKEPDFYGRLMTLLRGRKFYNKTVFSYGVLHKDTAAIRDLLPDVLMWETRFDAGTVLDSPLLTIDPIEQKTFQWLEYSPLVNARTHRLGADRVILNNKFRDQYAAFLHLLSFREAFSDEEKLGLAEALLLQDRLEESAAWLAAVKVENVHERLQYDYLQAWLAMSAGDLPAARRIATARTAAALPDRWAAKFQELTAQLDEIDGKVPANARPEDREATQGRLAAAEPQYKVRVESKSVTLDYRNLTEVTVNYYPMDLEFLFSANPFVGQDTARFRSIRPNQTERLTLAPDKTTHSFPLPAAWQNTNVLVEITAAGQTKAVASYANQLDVQISENYGQLQVRHAGDQRPLPKTYVKVFAQIEGKPVFYKDGYTDLRGKFDYTSLSTSGLDKTTRFSLLILSAEHGATVREAAPPAR